MLSAASQFVPLLDMLRAFGGEEVSDDDAEGLAAMMSFAQTATTVPVIASPVGAPSFRFIANLRRDALRVEAHEVQGEATLIGKIRRKLADGERYSVFEFFGGQNGLPRQLREELEAAFDDEEQFADALVTPPAALLTPVGLFR
jgi:hypothetical protein